MIKLIMIMSGLASMFILDIMKFSLKTALITLAIIFVIYKACSILQLHEPRQGRRLDQRIDRLAIIRILK